MVRTGLVREKFILITLILFKYVHINATAIPTRANRTIVIIITRMIGIVLCVSVVEAGNIVVEDTDEVLSLPK